MQAVRRQGRALGSLLESIGSVLTTSSGRAAEAGGRAPLALGHLPGACRATGTHALQPSGASWPRYGRFRRGFFSVADGGSTGVPGLAARLRERLLAFQAKGWEHFKKRLGKKSGSRGAATEAGAKDKKGAGGGGGGEGGPKPPPIRDLLTQLGLALFALAMVELASSASQESKAKEINWQVFYSDLLTKHRVVRVEVVNRNYARVYTRKEIPETREVAPTEGEVGPFGDPVQHEGQADDPRVRTRVVPGTEHYSHWFTISSPDSFERKLEDAQYDMGWKPGQYVPVTYVSHTSFLETFLNWAPSLVTTGILLLVARANMSALRGGGVGGRGGMGGGFMQVGKAQVTVIDPKTVKNPTTFKDVAGCDEAKEEIMEFVQFLKDPAKYNKLGAKIPKGALLVGPPGTGKTLLAKATAGESGVPFFSIAGSDFMEMFVGVGPARVRNLFAQARAQSPSIIFIDEIDAIGRSRGRGRVGGNEERENTLNQLLVEMDGFSTKEGVVVLAGTNRADILDRALLRPGRFDRQITVDTPDVKGRTAIFKVHLRKLTTEKEPDYYAERLAALTPGFAGADIANVCNEAALQAARKGDEKVTLRHFESAIDRVIGGLERKNRVVSKDERRTIALHEAGHAAVGWFLPYAEPLLKVSIVPRGSAALGFAQYLPNEDVLKTREQVEDMICMTLGGRAAEELIVGRVSTGAQNDLEKVTNMAYSMVTVYGFSPRIGLLSFPPREGALDKPYSPELARAIDEEVRKIVDAAYTKTKELVEAKRALITEMANALLEKEVLSLEDIEKVFGPRPFATREGSNIDRYRGIRKELEGEGARQEAPGKGKPSPPGESDVGEPSPSM